MTKLDILDAIRESAGKSDGVPPGMKRFATETGISVHVWRGRFWLRWSEALAEAGFSPNKVSEAYDDDFLLAKLGDLTRQHKHFPTYGEVVFAKTKDQTFPGAEALNRLGSKSARIELLKGFVSRTPEYADIIDFVPSSSPADVTDEDATVSPETEDMEGFVYMVRLRKHYKIGRTTAVPRRHREISLQLPEDPLLVHYIRTDDPEGIERYWHSRFATLRANGEWFALSPKEVRIFKRRRFM